MKKIIKPAEREESVYYSDFTGKVLNECGPDITLKLDFHYGSKRDGVNLELHLSDDDVVPFIDLIKSKISPDLKENLKKNLVKLDDHFAGAMQMRDWKSCDYFTNSIWFLRELLDISEQDDAIDDHLSDLGWEND